MTTLLRSSAVALAVPFVLAACRGPSDTAEAPAASASPAGSGETTSASMVASQTPAPETRRDRDPAFMKELGEVLAKCDKDWSVKHGFDHCGSFSDGTWKTFRAKKTFEKLEKTCLSLLEEKDVKLRWVGVQCFKGWPNWASVGELDAADADRFLAVLMREPADSPIDMALSNLAAKLSGDATKAKLRAYALAPKTPADVKIVLAVWEHDPAYYALVKGLRESSDKRLLAAALDGYTQHFDGHEGEACSLWRAHLEDDDKAVRRRAVGHLAGGFSAACAEDGQGYDNYCDNAGGPGHNMGLDTPPKNPAWCAPADVDAALAAIEKRVGEKTVDESSYTSGLSVIARHPKSTQAQKARAIAALRKHVDTTGAFQRSSAVRDLADADPGGLAYLRKYANDPDLKSEIESAQRRARERATKK